MKKKRRNKLLRYISGLLCIGLFFTQPAFIYGEEDYYDEYEDNYEEPLATATPTPDPHTQYYSQPADTNAIENWPQGPQIEAEAAVLVDMNTGAVLYSKNADQQMYPASITKILTLFLACEMLDQNGSLTMSESAAYGIEAGSSSIYADTGEVFTMEQAMMAIALESANEVCLAVAEASCGSVKKFVEKMNETARKIGCTGTHFNNPNGLPDELHYTTANDMAKIAIAACSNKYYRRYITTGYYEIPPTNVFPETRYLLNHHKMMAGQSYAYDGVTGGKTGYTQAAGNTLVTYAARNGMNLVCVVLNSVNGAFPDTAALLDYGFDNFQRLAIPALSNPVPLKRLASEKYLLNNGGNTYPFYSFQKYFYVTVPNGVDENALTEQKTLLDNAAGFPRLKKEYYYGSQLVGSGILYEQDILSDLLL